MVMAKGVKHFKKDGTLHTGGTHKMPNGEIHSGKTHGKTSVKLYHLKDLTGKAKEKAMAYYGPKKKKKPTKRGK
jgi:hypothetical protein